MSKTVVERTKSYWSTGQIAELCEVAGRTVTHWCDNGLLKANRIPGTGDLTRRVHQENLETFLRANHMDRELAKLGIRPAVLLVGTSLELVEQLDEVLGDGWQTHHACTTFQAGLLFERHQLQIVLLAGSLGRADCYGVAHDLLRKDPMPRVIVLRPEDQRYPWLPPLLGAEEWASPVDPAELATALRATVAPETDQVETEG